MTTVHRLIRDPAAPRRQPRDGMADVVILPCVRRERLFEIAAIRSLAERGGANPASMGDDQPS